MAVAWIQEGGSLEALKKGAVVPANDDFMGACPRPAMSFQWLDFLVTLGYTSKPTNFISAHRRVFLEGYWCVEAVLY
jgi:hypothetical protein